MCTRRGFIGCIGLALAAPAARAAEPPAPSREMLEFLADWLEADAETYELAVHHGLRDAERKARDEDSADE